MHDNTAIVEARLDRFVRERITPALYRRSAPLEVSAWQPEGEPVPFETASAQDFRPFAVGTPWGVPWSTTWFRVTGAVPSEWFDSDGAIEPATQLEMVVDLGFNHVQTGFQSEALVYTLDGVPLKGISPLNAHVPAAVVKDGTVDVFVEAAANPDLCDEWSFAPTALGDPSTSGRDPIYVLTRVDVALLDCEVWELAQDVRVLSELMRQLPARLPRRAGILRALERMLDAVDPHDVAGTAAAGRLELATELGRPAYSSAHELHAVGHAHIDSAWLWPLRETIRKCARTFSNVLSLMDEQPEFTFACSSAQQFQWMKDFYPDIYARIREKVAQGQFLPVGGMWVEADTNLPGSEALARQFVAGKKFFLEEFGIDCQEVWLPDSFGYSGSLPQIVAAAGNRWFLTQKISWNQTNTMPHHTFHWEGIDGTRVFTHFPPVDKYNSDLSAADISHAETNFAEQGIATKSLLPYGYGDGGGGPTREMFATVKRTRSLEGSARLETSTPRRFFEEAESEYPNPPIWTGELYLEAQRGTYTSQLPTKQGNRRAEVLLREAELWATTAAVRAGAEYPTAELESIWQTVLLHQFHDILPGSSIAWVHREAERTYAELHARLEAIIEGAARTLLGEGPHDVSLNAAPHALGSVPALGGGAVHRDGGAEVSETSEGFVLGNGLIRAVFDREGLLVSLVDLKAQRETIPAGTVGNLFQLHRDTPNEWDAWDIDDHYRHVVEDLTDDGRVAVTDGGRSLTITRSFGASTIVETVTLRADEPQLDFRLEIDWHETQKLVKLAFPIDIATDRFASEIQFGHIQRPTHSNTSWDYARFETCAHKWIHVADPHYGFAILNDSTYGYDVTRQANTSRGTWTMARLSILRAPLYPDPAQDQGWHTLRVSLVVGATVADAVRGGYALNNPPRVIGSTSATSVEPLVSLSNPAAVVESVKLAEDGSGDVIVRLYESEGAPAQTDVGVGFAATAVTRTDLLERALDGVPETLGRDASLSLTFRPFEIVTLRFVRDGSDELI